MTVKAVVIGGGGFIGAHVVKALSDSGLHVTALDTFPQDHARGNPSEAAGRYRRESLLRTADLARVDIEDAAALERCLATIDPNYVIHAAGMSLATTARALPRQACNSIFVGTFNVLEAARTCPALQRLVYVSSSMTYGHFVRPVVRETEPAAPVDLYGGLKLAAEELARCYSRMHGIPISVVRPTSVYGPGDVNGRVIQTLLEGARAGVTVRVRNPDTTFLDFSYVTDVADGIKLAALRSEGPERTFNISFGSARSLADVVAAVRNMYPLAQLVFEDKADFRPRRGTLDTGRARDQLGFAPAINLETGLQLYNAFLDQCDQDNDKRAGASCDEKQLPLSNPAAATRGGWRTLPAHQDHKKLTSKEYRWLRD